FYIITETAWTIFTSTDMISVLLTNGKEAMEFLQSHLGLGPLVLILVVFAVYMALIVCLVIRGSKIEAREITYSSRVRKIIVAVLVLASFVTIAHWIPRIFPAWPYHVAYKYLMNSRKAADAHNKNLEEFSFIGPKPDKLPGTVIVVIGESANRNHLKAFNENYPADTTPWLSSQKNNKSFYLMTNAYTNYPLTAQALSLFLSDSNQYNQLPLDKTVTITDVANKIGYDTYWISNQAMSVDNIMLAVSVQSSKQVLWTKKTAGDDKQVINLLKNIPKETSNFIVIHLEGSHDRYKDRTPPDFDKINISGNSTKVNDYDSSIKYTDEVLKGIYQYAKDNMNLQALVYCSDHGEDMQYFHGGSRFTWDMTYVPAFVYLAPGYEHMYPEIARNLEENRTHVFTNDLIFDTVCGILNAPNTGYNEKYDLTSKSYGLTREDAVTKHGAIHISNDPALNE
ncbi:phosphoethanolamine transferase, partial [Dialister sp.]|uniref:phosphoethanolamine transferase n=1 Tax=Dialister sp. TaxID=1955814 RepID=UPI003F0AE127